MYKVTEKDGVVIVNAAPLGVVQDAPAAEEKEKEKKESPFAKLSVNHEDRIRARARAALGVGVIDDSATRENIRSIIAAGL